MSLTHRSSCILSRLVTSRSLSVNHFANAKQSSTNNDTLVTHTGQNWAPDDYRNVRFMNVPKQVNQNWAINLIKEVPPVAVEGNIAVCEGGPSEALGHPKIYINLDQPGNHSCTYCGIRFFKKEGAH